jgi:hypothetical protein
LFVKGKLPRQTDIEDEYLNLGEALAAGREVEDCRQRAQALIRLIPRLAPFDRREVQHKVLAAVYECAQNAYRWTPGEIMVSFFVNGVFIY